MGCGANAEVRNTAVGEIARTTARRGGGDSHSRRRWTPRPRYRLERAAKAVPARLYRSVLQSWYAVRVISGLDRATRREGAAQIPNALAAARSRSVRSSHRAPIGIVAGRERWCIKAPVCTPVLRTAGVGGNMAAMRVALHNAALHSSQTRAHASPSASWTGIQLQRCRHIAARLCVRCMRPMMAVRDGDVRPRCGGHGSALHPAHTHIADFTDRCRCCPTAAPKCCARRAQHAQHAKRI